MTELTYLRSMCLDALIETFAGRYASTLLQATQDYGDLFRSAWGSKHNHQAWRGGYADHIAECLRIHVVYAEGLRILNDGVLPFAADDAVLAIYLHDIEKPFHHAENDMAHHPDVVYWRKKAEDGASWHDLQWEIQDWFCAKYGIELNADVQNALKYAHGEGEDHRKDIRVAGPLAAHVHHCDNTSARIFFDVGRGLG